MELNNPILTALPSTTTTTSGGGGSSGGGSSCAATVAITVSAQFAANGANWMDHVQTAATNLACNGATTTGGFNTCIHGGERRRADLTGIADCTGLTVSDNLGAFDWKCDDNGASDAYVFSTGLKKGKGLADLINATGTGFLTNYVTVTSSTCTVAQSTAAVWWTEDTDGNCADGDTGTNCFQVVSDALDQTPVTIDESYQEGTILTVPNDTTIDGIFIGDPDLVTSVQKIAIVTLGSSVLRYSGMGYDDGAITDADDDLDSNGNCLFSGVPSTVSNTSCLVSVYGTRFAWVEGKYLGTQPGTYTATYAPHTPNDAHSIVSVLRDNYYTTLRNITTTGGTYTRIGLYIGSNGGTYGVANSRGYNINLVSAKSTSSSMTGTGMKLGASQYSTFEKVTIAGNNDLGLELYDSHYNNFIHTKIYANGGFGVVFDGATRSDNNVFVNLLSAGNSSVTVDKAPVVIRKARQTTIHMATVGNYTNAGAFPYAVDIYDASGPQNASISNLIVANTVSHGLAIEELATGKFHNIASSNTDGKAIAVQGASTSITFSGGIWVGNNDGGNPDCTNTVGAQANIDANCDLNGGADPALSTTLDVLSDWIGGTTDATNTHGGTGTSTYAALTDWLNFDSFLKIWGLDDGSAALTSTDRGSCVSGGNCRIMDLALNAATTLKSVNGTFTAGAACPAGVDASNADNVFADLQTASNTYLVNAIEITGDFTSAGVRIGDDDGLCEDGEACYFNPDMGASSSTDANTTAGSCTGFVTGNGINTMTMYGGS